MLYICLQAVHKFRCVFDCLPMYIIDIHWLTRFVWSWAAELSWGKQCAKHLECSCSATATSILVFNLWRWCHLVIHRHAACQEQWLGPRENLLVASRWSFLADPFEHSGFLIRNHGRFIYFMLIPLIPLHWWCVGDEIRSIFTNICTHINQPILTALKAFIVDDRWRLVTGDHWMHSAIAARSLGVRLLGVLCL